MHLMWNFNGVGLNATPVVDYFHKGLNSIKCAKAVVLTIWQFNDSVSPIMYVYDILNFSKKKLTSVPNKTAGTSS